MSLTGCSLIQGLQEQLALTKASFSFERVDLVSADVPLLTPDPKADLNLVLRVQNPNPITARLDQMQYTVSMEGNPVATGSTGDGFSVSPNATSDLVLPLSLHYSILPSAVVEAIQKRSALFDLQGTSMMDTPIGSLALPFTLTKQENF